MPIKKNWSSATRDHIVQNVPSSKGVYELRSFGKQVYVGKASNLQRRLLEHLNERNPNKYRFKKVGLLRSAKSYEDTHLSRFEEIHGRLPAWNENDTR